MKTELCHKFDYPDGKRNHIKEICLLMGFSLLMTVLLLVTICHADKIDKFAMEVLKAIV